MLCTSCSIRSLVNMVRRGNVTGAYDYAAKHSTEGLLQVFEHMQHIEGNQPNDEEAVSQAILIVQEALVSKQQQDLGA